MNEHINVVFEILILFTNFIFKNINIFFTLF